MKMTILIIAFMKNVALGAINNFGTQESMTVAFAK
jgi:hypothetical protein